MYEPHNVQGRLIYAMTVKKKKNGNNHGTFTTKVVRSVFVLLATRGTISCKVTGGRRYSIDLYILLNLLSCTVHKSAHVISYHKLSLFKLLSIKFHEFNFRCSLALQEYFNNEIFPNDGTFLLGSPSFQSFVVEINYGLILCGK